MNPIIQTNRFYLREKLLSDAKDMYLLNADPEVIKYTGDPPFKDENDALVFIKNYDHFQKYGFGRWVIVNKHNDEYLGWCGLKKHESGMIDLGYRIKKEHWGKGIASEAAAACLDYGFNILNINEIVGRSASANIASIRILEKIGMKFWKKDTCDGISDAVWYKIIKGEL
jgi:RimJ/RimL family protein N-acetyltransferase